MSVKHPGPVRRPWKKTVGASVWLFVLFAGPSSASHYVETEDDCVGDARYSEARQELTAVAVAGFELEPRGEAAILAGLQSDAPASLRVIPGRTDDAPSLAHDDSASALAESSADPGDEFSPDLRSDPQEIDGLDASVPGLSDEELRRFRRQMYRKDI